MIKITAAFFYISLYISKCIPRSRFGRWFFFTIVDFFYELAWLEGLDKIPKK